MVRVRRTDTFIAWLKQLKDIEGKVRITQRLDRLAHGNAGDIKPIGGGISEMRVHAGPGYRLYCTWKGDVLVVLLCGGDKRTQQRDIERARGLLAEIGEDGWLN